ncbi:MAG: ABC transporter ATP-binding protein [Limnohabitans sp.]|nr:ATP-binding cassette domain-containing protein [Limnohabitans sp.]
MLEIHNLNASYGQAQVLFNVSLLVPRGNMLLIRGLNGAGKSSLLKAIMGLMPQSTGNVLWQGQALHSLKPHERSLKGLGYVPEDRRLFSALTVRQNLEIATPNQPKHRPHGQPGLQLQEVLELFPSLSSMLERPAAQMSGGEQQMLAIGRTLMTQADVLILDEPCEGIAPILVLAIARALAALKSQGYTFLIAEQNQILTGLADKELTLSGGVIQD